MSPLEGTILVVDDHDALAENVAEILGEAGFQTAWTDSAEAALELVARGDVAAVITDYRLPGLSGAELISELRRRGVDIPVVVISAHTDADTINLSASAGAMQVLAKPVDVDQLLNLVNQLRRGDPRILLADDDRLPSISRDC